MRLVWHMDHYSLRSGLYCLLSFFLTTLQLADLVDSESSYQVILSRSQTAFIKKTAQSKFQSPKCMETQSAQSAAGGLCLHSGGSEEGFGRWRSRHLNRKFLRGPF